MGEELYNNNEVTENLAAPAVGGEMETTAPKGSMIPKGVVYGAIGGGLTAVGVALWRKFRKPTYIEVPKAIGGALVGKRASTKK